MINKSQATILDYLKTLPTGQGCSAKMIGRKTNLSYNTVHINLWKLYRMEKVKYHYTNKKISYFWYIKK